MKPLLIFILSLFLTFNAFGQQPEYPDSGFTNKAEAKNLMVNGKKEGKWVEYMQANGDSGYVLEVYKNGVDYGTVRTYYRNGNLRSYIPTTNNKINGVFRIYYKSGKLYEEALYVDGKPDGIDKQYYDSGKIKSEVTYNKGVVVGTKKYDENGNEIKQ